MPEAWTDEDRRMMSRALELAERGVGWTSPNPMVGAVVVRNGEIVGEGFHPRVGYPHAEPIALDQAGTSAEGATLYVTLEPCAHHGRTPPCLDRVVASRVARVVIAMEDPDPRTSGKSIDTLRQKGMEVSVGLLESEARRLNQPFLSSVLRSRPWVTLKYAMTLDGRIAVASGDSRWISNQASRSVVHDLRRRRRAILVGWRTYLVDDPQLNVRGDFDPSPRQPLRIVLGGGEGLKCNSNLARTTEDSPVLHVLPQGAAASEPEGVESIELEAPEPFSREGVSSLLEMLHNREIDSLLVEGGARTLTAFFEADVVDEIYVFVAPRILDDAAAVSPFVGARLRESIAESRALLDVEITPLEGDVLIHGWLNRL